MAKQFSSLNSRFESFIREQRIFFVGSAAEGTRINISPRSTEHLHILGPNEVAYLDLTGSGSETSAHLRAGSALTVMFCAFDEPPLILRLYGTGRVAFRGSPEYVDFLDRFYERVEPVGGRQVVFVTAELVQSSCGFGVPLFDFVGERPVLDRWAEAKGEDGLRAYRAQKNLFSIDGLSTGFEEPESTLWPIRTNS